MMVDNACAWDYFSDEELETNHEYEIQDNTLIVDNIFYHIKAAAPRGFFVIRK